MIATTLNFDYEVRSAEEAFADVPKMKIQDEMLDLARHIIATKAGEFDPKAFDDRYETALADVVRAKIEGKKIKPRKPPPETKVVDLMEALRQSAKAEGGQTASKKPTTKRKVAAKSSGKKAKKAAA